MSTQAADVEAVEDVKNTIRSCHLEPTEHFILIDSFLGSSCDQEAAAREVRRRLLSSPGEPVERVLRQLKADWHAILCTALEQTAVDEGVAALLKRRDEGRCCLSPPTCPQVKVPIPEYILSPKLEPLLRVENQEPEARLLQAFVSPRNVPYLRRVFSENTASMSNAWSLSPGLGIAIRQGKLSVRGALTTSGEFREPISMEDIREMKLCSSPYVSDLQYCDGNPWKKHDMRIVKLRTSSPSETPLPSPYLVQLQNTFANALSVFSVEEECAQPWPERQAPKFWNRSWLLFFRNLWHLVPRFLRTWTYRRMLQSREGGRVVQLYESKSAGLIAKSDRGNEAAALALLEAEAPEVLAPLLIDTFQDDEGRSIAVITQLPGVPAKTVFYRMSYEEQRQFADDLGKALAHMRRVPNRSGHLFTGISSLGRNGSKIHDRHAGYEACGPFETELDWTMSMTGGRPEFWRPSHPEALLSEHKSVFTHGDLHLFNVLVDGGKLSGIVDWESSGFYPEYWECAKSMNTGLNAAWFRPVHRQIWQGKYEAESELVGALMNTFLYGPPRIGEP
ncbi:kinase-like domain [Cordyceps militaris]|uniref:Kinase-like domain n=1 Tax=Cordyceps militaris TaxID=73501 RepID=A0A2H4SA38_CORMI|nr:kinase-like domain [Cordyceps militaris]